MKKGFSWNEWLLLNANWAVIFQLYHGENKLLFRGDDHVRFVLKPTHLSWIFNSDSSLIQQSAGRQGAALWFRDNQSVILLPRAACLAEKQ